MTTKPTYAELEQRIRVLEETAKGEWIQTAVDTSVDAIGMSTVDGYHFYQNKSFDHMFGYTLEEISRLHPRKLYGNEHVAREVFETIMVGRSWHGEIEMVTKNGRHFPVLLRADAIKDENGDVIGLIGVHTDITERKLAEQALQESEERFRRFSAAAFEAIIIHDEGILISANDQYYEMFGYEPEELMGKQAMMLTVATEAIDAIKKEIATGGMGPYESIGIKKDGTKFPIEIRVREWKYEGRKVRVAAIMDITERKHAEKMLQRYNQRLMILHQIDRGIVGARSPKELVNAVLKHIRGLVSCWMASVALYDHDTNEIVIFASDFNGNTMIRPGLRIPIPEDWGPRILAEHYQIVDDVNELPGPILPAIQLAMDEGMRSYIRVSLLVEGTSIGGLLLAGRTPSAFSEEDLQIASEVADQLAIAIHQARLKEQIERHAAELEEKVARRTAELRDINAELKAFTYSVSHDLKAPLRGIDGYSRLLLLDHVDKMDEEGQTFLHTIRSATQQMNQLIDDLLAYSRLERRPMKTGKLNPREVVEMVIAERADELQQRQVTINVNIPCGSVTAEAEGLVGALRNLLENALKFSRDLPAPRIEIGGRETDNTCILWVRDNGIGFDMQYHDRIFEIFQRLHRAEDYPGTGIGLAIVRKVLQRMGGRVWGDSTPGHGATFYLEVPK
jgi:PAS domain S-box-containing protein